MENFIKTIKFNFLRILDYIIPIRPNFKIVKDLKFEDIIRLPKSKPVTNYGWINPLFKYKNIIVKAIIWEIKYKENTDILEHIGKILFDEIVELTSEIMMFDMDAKFILLPIPISNQRRSVRGYNQCEYICRSILENDIGHFLLYAPQWFLKIKETPIQSKSSKEERMKNLKGCFSANENVSGKYIILIDDVITTGSTLSEARQTLLSAGAKNVIAFTLAH